MLKLLIRWVAICLALFLAVWIVPGIEVDGNGWIVYAVMAVILALVNSLVRPVLKLLTCPLIILTLGLFTLVINGFTLWLSAQIAVQWFSVGFYVHDFWAAFLGALIVSAVTTAVSLLVKDNGHKDEA